MRADRLLKLILLLSDGRARSARALADGLEISLRTLFRDLDALSLAGIPVITTRGRYGGIALPREWIRYASGLLESEVIPLAALAVPADEGLRGPMAAALGKIVAGLPQVLRARAEEARQRLLIDPSPFWSSPEPTPVLERLRQAVWSDTTVQLRYRDARGNETERVVGPLSLVLKADRWHLVGETEDGLRVFRGDRVQDALLLDNVFHRPPDFDLPSFWRAWCQDFVSTRPCYRVGLQLTEQGRTRLAQMRPAAERPDILASALVEIDFQTQDIALSQLVGLGTEVIVIGPADLLERMRQIASHWLAR